jgi:mannose-6-phosphate isomerase-like protein (cupin superfamily)
VTTFAKWNDETRYRVQTDLIRAALGTDGHELDALLAGMEASKNEGTIYLCGRRLDNEYCFGSDDLGLLISKLPKGGAKAGIPGYHPGSTETWVILQGGLTLGWLDQGELRSKSYSRSDVVVIPPGQCHRVDDAFGREAASLIVKTNLRHEPGVVRCQECTHFGTLAECPVRASWLEEKKEWLERTLARLSEEADRQAADIKAKGTTPAALGQVLAVRKGSRVAAEQAVQTWLHDDGQPELDWIAGQLLQQAGLD